MAALLAMSYQAPEPFNPIPMLQEALRQRLAMYQQPTQTQVLAPAIADAFKSIAGGAFKAYENRGLLQAKQDYSDFLAMSPTDRRLPENQGRVQRGIHGALALGLTPPPQQMTVDEEAAKAAKIESAKEGAKNSADLMAVTPVIKKMYADAGYGEPGDKVSRQEYAKVAQEAASKGAETNRKGAEDRKQKSTDDKFWAQQFRNFTPTNATRGSLIGQAAYGNARADRALVELSKNPNSISPQLKSFITTDLAGIMQGGAPHADAVKEAGFDTVLDDWARLKTKFTGKVAEAEVPGIIAELKRLIGSIKEVDNKIISDNLDAFEATNSEYIGRNPDKWKKIRSSVMGTTVAPNSNKNTASLLDKYGAP